MTDPLSGTPLRRPEVLAPAGDEAAMRAAVRAGADAVYFGLPGFNARARATNFDLASLRATMDFLHAHDVRGYVALNTLLFDAELPALEAAVRACAGAGVDAVIVQDLGVARLVKAVAPSLAVHASTQMTCTDAASVAFAQSLGVARVILARELSLDEIHRIRSAADVDLEVFVHGALCIAYSGQCLTSEAIGGRSANRGACAQACRLPYELVVDGVLHDLGDRAYLLSPEDLEASRAVPELVALGVASIKIEGRLKGPEYVAASTRLYRAAVANAVGEGPPPDRELRDTALQMYSRGSGEGFLRGVDHQRLVEGVACDHRGLQAGECLGTREVRGRTMVRVRTEREMARGDGVLVEGSRGVENEVGGRVWMLYGADGAEIERAGAHTDVLVWLGPEKTVTGDLRGRRVWKTNDPVRERAVQTAIEREPERVPLDLRVHGAIGTALVIEAHTARGRTARVETDAVLARATTQALTVAVLRDKLGKLGESPFALREFACDIPGDSIVPHSSLNRARRTLVEALGHAAQRTHATTDTTATDLLARALPPSHEPPAGGLWVLCRTIAQAHAALDAGADGVYLDFLELTGTGAAMRELRARGARQIGVAPPRIRKPGDDKIDRYLAALAPDAVLVRSLGALHEPHTTGVSRIGDFSLNVVNRLAAHEVMAHGLAAFTPAYDLDAHQLIALLESPFASFAEVVVHHPMPLFHMEHCVIAATFSTGHDHRDCGRPCETHQLSLRDRAGMDHPVEADVGCRNTVFHAAAQSAAGIVGRAKMLGTRRFRIELVREGAGETSTVVEHYRALIEGRTSAADVWRALRTEGTVGVVRGTLRVV